MAVTPLPLTSLQATTSQPVFAMEITPPKSGPLWRFALVGLGPLTALGVFALLVALLQRLA